MISTDGLVFKFNTDEITIPKSKVVANAEKVVANVVANSRHGKYADLEKRRAYQREYMRKKRADKKGG